MHPGWTNVSQGVAATFAAIRRAMLTKPPAALFDLFLGEWQVDVRGKGATPTTAPTGRCACEEIDPPLALAIGAPTLRDGELAVLQRELDVGMAHRLLQPTTTVLDCCGHCGCSTYLQPGGDQASCRGAMSSQSGFRSCQRCSVLNFRDGGLPAQAAAKSPRRRNAALRENVQAVWTHERASC